MKLTTKHRRLIKQLANQLPFQQSQNYEVLTITGEELLLSGQTEVEGNPIEPEKEYFMKNPVYREIRHEKRMARHFQNFGISGILGYVEKFVIPDKRDSAKQKIMQIWNQ